MFKSTRINSTRALVFFLALLAAINASLFEKWLEKESNVWQEDPVTLLSDDTTHQEVLDLQQQVDRLCTVSNIEGNICYITDKRIRLHSDLSYSTSYQLIFDNSYLKCYTTAGLPCTLGFQISDDGSGQSGGLTLRNGSILQGKQVVVYAPKSRVTITDTSSINVTGQSYNTNGTQELGAGASFVGQGGHCTAPDKSGFHTYGEFDMTPGHKMLSVGSQLGSMGMRGDVESAGGGRIVLVADHVIFDTKGASLQANALPLEGSKASNSSLPGGSGGYIYVDTLNENVANSISVNATIEACGGHGQSAYMGGAGGSIVFDNNFSIEPSQVNTAGGLALTADQSFQEGCGNGAAGTIWYRTQNRLVVDNRKVLSSRYTLLRIPQDKNSSAPGVAHQIAEEFLISGSARVVLLNTNHYVRFHSLTMEGASQLAFGSDADSLTVEFTKESILSPNVTWDFSRSARVYINSSDDALAIHVSNIHFRKTLRITCPELHLHGTLSAGAAGARPAKSYLILDSKSLFLHEKAVLTAGFTLLQANDTIESEAGARIVSLENNTCNVDEQFSDPFSCVPLLTLQDSLTVESFLSNFNSQFKTNHTQLRETLPIIAENFTVYLMALGEQGGIDLHGTTIEGPRVGLCANNISLNDSIVNTTARGCISDSGIGAGHGRKNCSGAGGAHGGTGGYGAAYMTENAQTCEAEAPKGYYYKREARYEGSGGGSGIHNGGYGGAGGGIIWLSTPQGINLNASKLLSNGGDGVANSSEQVGSGGGAGGSVQLITNTISGDGRIEVAGGAGSLFGGGGGSGGRLVVDITQSFRALDQTLDWDGSFSLAGGAAGSLHTNSISYPYTAPASGQEGTTLHSKCFGGYSGPFCAPCPVGEYKFNYGYALCKTCENKPQNAYYTERAAAQSQCPFECSQSLEPFDVNPKCENSLQMQMTRLGGPLTSLLLLGAFLSAAFAIWAGLSMRSSANQRAQNKLGLAMYEGVLGHQPALAMESEQIVSRGALHLRDSDVTAHVHRTYLIGDNSVDFPWYMPKDFPSGSLLDTDQLRLLHMIKNEQSGLDWTFFQRSSLAFVRLFAPYLSGCTARAFRRRHFTWLSERIFRAFDTSFWDNQGGKNIRVSASSIDYQLAYVDFLDFSKDRTHYGGPKMPLCLMLAGNGTFETPYNLRFEEDSLAKSLVHLNPFLLKSELPPFFENLNTLLAKLSFYKFPRQAMRDLDEVIEQIDLANKSLFTPLDLKATLYLFENCYQCVAGGNFKQRRRSLPLEPLVFEAFPRVFKSLICFVQNKLLSRKSEIRFGLILRPHDAECRRKLQERLKKLIQSDRASEAMTNEVQAAMRSGAGGGNVINSMSLLFADELNEQEKPDYSLNMDGEEELTGGVSVPSESNMEASEAFLDGVACQAKIIDKSKRAYDLSSESTLALELALQKRKGGCSHKCGRFRAFWYSLWILALKHHGRPPARKGLSCLFLYYSAFVSMDLLLTATTLLHVLHPLDNVWTFGLPWLFVLPLVTVLGPIFGLFGSVLGSSSMLKTYSSLNATTFLVNAPLTLAYMIYLDQQFFYLVVIVLLMLNKILVSYYGAKVRQHLINPGFTKNQKKLQQRFRNVVSARADILTKTKLTPAERAAMLTASGTPSEGLMGSFAEGHSSGEDEQSDDKSDDHIEIDDEDEQEEIYGIISKEQLATRARQDLQSPDDRVRQDLSSFDE